MDTDRLKEDFGNTWKRLAEGWRHLSGKAAHALTYFNPTQPDEAAEDAEERSRRESSDFLQYCNEDGSFADFHANRHTFISKLIKTGVGVKLAQFLARHSDPYLTMNPYGHVDAAEPSDAINKVVGPPPMERLSTSEHRSTAAEAV